MASLKLSEVLDHWVVGRTRTFIEPRMQVLRQMSHLPPHLIDDVNARGFPPDTRPVQANSKRDNVINLRDRK